MAERPLRPALGAMVERPLRAALIVEPCYSRNHRPKFQTKFSVPEEEPDGTYGVQLDLVGPDVLPVLASVVLRDVT